MVDRPSILLPLLDDLRAEGDDLDRSVASLDPAGWATPTPAAGWTITHQISHLAWTDRMAIMSITDAAGFAAELEKAASTPDTYVDAGAAEGLDEPSAALLARWRDGRAALIEAVTGMPDGAKAPWYGPPMRAASIATGRLMETWAHGQDVADALGIERPGTARLRHIARLGVRTRGYGYLVRGLPEPAGEVRVELTAPDGSLWAWGPDDAADRVSGPALDFCLLVTQRRHRDDLALRAEGGADEWLSIAQTFAGPPGAGRAPLNGRKPGEAP